MPRSRARSTVGRLDFSEGDPLLEMRVSCCELTKEESCDAQHGIGPHETVAILVLPGQGEGVLQQLSCLLELPLSHSADAQAQQNRAEPYRLPQLLAEGPSSRVFLF